MNSKKKIILLRAIFSFCFSFLIFSGIIFAATTSILRPASDGSNDSVNWSTETGAACSGTNCYIKVYESSGGSCGGTSDGNTTYVQGGTQNARQTFYLNISSIPDNSIITQVDITTCHEKGDTGTPNTFQTVRCINGSCLNSGTNITSGGSYTQTAQSHTSLSITKLSSTTFEVGTVVTGTSGKRVRISAISTVITYSLPPAPTVDIKANSSDGPITIPYNTSATLSWTSTNATSCTASGDWSGSKSTSGSQSTGNLTSSKSYTLTCTGAGGSSSDTVVINVSPPTPTVDIKADGSDGPITIPYNTSATLSWTSTNATSCTASGDWLGSKSTSGSQSTGNLTSSNSYTLTCTGPGGSASDSVTVNVSPPPTPTVDIKANGLDSPITIDYNTSATLSWTSTNVTSCTASGDWSGSKATSSSESTGNLTSSKVYTLTCAGIGGFASHSVVVNVNSPSAPTVDIKADSSDGPITIDYNISATLSWTSTNATSCTASGDWSGSKSTSGSESTGNLISTKTYNISCVSPGGSSSDSVVIDVNPSPTPTIDIKANSSDGPITIDHNTSATISWTSTNATSCTASGDWSGVKSTSGSESTGNLISTKTYIIECFGTASSVIDSVTINIGSLPPSAPTVDIKADSSDGPITIDYNTSAALSWTSTNATSCTASGDWSGSKSTSGSESTGNLTSPRTYTIECSGTASSVIDSVTVNAPTSPPSTLIVSQGGGGASPTTAEFTGQAYPGSKIEILRKSIEDEVYRNIPLEDTIINENGSFYIRFVGLLQGDYVFFLRAEDKNKQKSGIISFSADFISENKLAAKDIFVPPTVSLNKAAISKEEKIKISGYAAPNNNVLIYLDDINIATTTSDINGAYSHEILLRENFNIGDHYIKTKQIDSSGKLSNFSPVRVFRISSLAFPQIDFNNDNKIDIRDWSIFLSRWSSKDKNLKIKNDLNGDGKVDIFDLSIFLKGMRNYK